jgi:hypothetical protein
MEDYISGLIEVPTGVKTLSDLIAFNTAHESQELIPPFWMDQSQYVFDCAILRPHQRKWQARHIGELH